MIDIIIPVYNTPINDLERCFFSILNQTYTDYNVYIIDDGSSLSVKKYLDDYVKDKDNFFVKHILNGGVSNARNIGIEISKSNYIAFVDADDTLERNFLNDALRIIENNHLDIVIGGYHEVKDGNITRTRVSLPGLHIYEGASIKSFMCKLLTSKVDNSNKEIGDCPVGRIYTRLFRKSSIGDLRFNTHIHMSEDTLFMIDYVKRANKIGIIDKVWYNYYINDYSISNGTKKEKLIQDINDFIVEIQKRKDMEEDNLLKDAYQSRIEKANSYLLKVKNSR